MANWWGGGWGEAVPEGGKDQGGKEGLLIGEDEAQGLIHRKERRGKSIYHRWDGKEILKKRK